MHGDSKTASRPEFKKNGRANGTKTSGNFWKILSINLRLGGVRMEDKDLMENLLLLEKGACGLYLHGSIESETVSINQAFTSALMDSLTLQDDIYSEMSDKGWYPTEPAEQQKMQQVKQKYSMQ